MSVLEQLLAELSAKSGGGGAQYRAAPSTPSTPYYTGPQGLFGALGLERDIFSTRVQPHGIASILPTRASVYMNPLFPYLTGFQVPVGSNKENVCDDAPVAGAGKSCLQTATFGRYEYATRTVEIDRLGQLINRGEFDDLRFVNDPLLNSLANITPGVPQSAALGREVLMRFIELGVSFQNKLGRQVYEANPVNNSGGNGYREFPGLDILIGTGKVDAETGTTCPALDSLLRDAAYKRIDSNAEYYINMLSYMLRTLRTNAMNQNFGDVVWNIVMRPTMFYELTSVWPCAYNTYRCNVIGSNNQGFVDAADMNRQRDDMRTGQYLLLDGIRIPVILDSFIQEDTNTDNASVTSGCFASDIYIIPMTVRGGMPVTYWEHLDYAKSIGLAQDGQLPANFFWTDGGRFMWTFKPPTNWCIQWQSKIEPRLILRTPHLAARLQNVMYCPTIHENDPINTDPYFVNGGVTTGRTAPSYYNEW